MHPILRRMHGLVVLARRFGPVAGARVALASRRAKWAGEDGALVELRIPEFRRPFWVRAGGTDIRVFDQVVVYRELEGVAGERPSVVIDGGANIGLSALVFANWWPNATIVCLEVDTANIELLRRNVAEYPNIHLIAAGLWSHATQLAITNGDAESWAFQVAESAAGNIPALGIADVMQLMGLARIDVLKLDIEGAELQVMQSAAAWIDRVDVLMVELHDRTHPGCRAAFDAALAGKPFTLTESGEYVVATRAAPALRQGPRPTRQT